MSMPNIRIVFSRRRLKTMRRLFSLVLGVWLLGSEYAYCGRSTFRLYNADQGLVSLGGTCMLQDHAGHILVCTEQGVFTYDGRRFVNLGADQGLRDGGFIYGMALTANGRIAVGYDGEIRISDRPSDPFHPPRSLRFQRLLHPNVPFSSTQPNRFASWQDGLALLAGDETIQVVLPKHGSPYVKKMGYDLAEEKLLQAASSVFAVRGQLWEAFHDGRLCLADPGAVRCYGDADGLRSGPWLDVVAGPGTTVMARSATSVGTFDPRSGRWTTIALPDQGDRYANFANTLGLFKDPAGHLVTQADHGLAILRDGVWKAMSIADGAPTGTIVSAMTDATGQFWLQAVGLGVIRWIGYGQWEAVDQAAGLSDGFAWRTVRLSDGSMWVSTDTGIDKIVRRDGTLQVAKVVAGSSFALEAGPSGRIWSGSGRTGVRILDPTNGSWSSIDTPPVNAIISDPAGYVWIGSEAGLFRAIDRVGVPLRVDREGSSTAQVADMVRDGHGGVFYLASGRLRHWHDGGNDAAVTGSWPEDSFDTLVMALGHDGSLWIGGSSGLFRFRLVGDRVASYELIPITDTQSSTIVAVMVDHRGWIWAGTALGISVFDGTRWTSVDAGDGLLASDVDQGGLREDPDGSVWIVTSHGLSHLLDPERLFKQQPIEVIISDARLGSRLITGHRIPYSTADLSVQFGTPTYAAERSIVFRYQLSGVDANWVDTTTGTIRYPSVPPGYHRLTVMGIDPLTHRSSDPRSLVIDIGYPWWRKYWAEAIWLLCLIGSIYGLMRLRFRVILARQAQLKRHVAQATEQLRIRTEQLHYQATHDSLTGLLNRSETERRLAAVLAASPTNYEMIVALLDIDHFKRVNDRYGHLGGDDVLRTVGHLVVSSIQEGELAGRYGGEEILLVLQDADGIGARRVLELHRAIELGPFMTAGMAIDITCSIGLTWAVRGDDWETLVGRADEALYQAKASGRNSVVENPRAPPRNMYNNDRRS